VNRWIILLEFPIYRPADCLCQWRL